MPQPALSLILSLLFLLPLFAADSYEKVPIKVARDGFPVGSDTPEGAACNLARAFIYDDTVLFLSTCVEPRGDSTHAKEYRRFLDDIVSQMKQVANKSGSPSPDAPRSLLRCCAARHLKNKQPAIFGKTNFGLLDIAFVDVTVSCLNGSTHLCRTLLYKTPEGKWIVNPRPDLSPYLSTGLEDESDSKVDFTKVYQPIPADQGK